MNIAASILFTFIIFFPPLALGAANIYFATILQAAILALFYSRLLRSAKNGFFEYIKTPINIFFAAFIFYTLFQLLFKVTRYPYGTELSLINAAVFFMLFFSAAKFVDTPEKIDEVIFKITVSGFVVSVIGIMQALTKAGSIYWLVKPPHQNFFGTFINENSFACYTSMVALVTLGSIFSSMHSWERISGDMPVKRILVNTINNILDKKTLFEILAFSVMAYSVFISKSRSGMTFLAVSMLLFIVFMFRRHKTTIISAAMGLIAAYFLLSRFGIDVASNRLGSMLLPDSYVGRTVIYEAGLKLFGDYPVFGIGLGAFSNIFPMYNYGMEIFTFRHLHNDILQLLIESGFLGFSLIVIPLLLFFLAAVSKISRTANTYKYCVGLSILSAFFYLALHSLTDFQLRMNAISSLSVILLAALAFIAVFGEKKSVRRINILLPRTLSYALLSVLFMACLFIISRPLAAHVLSGSGRIGAVRLAMRLEPENGENYLQYARSVFNEAKSGRMPKKAAIKEAETALGKAIRINPYKTDYKISIARVYAMQYEYTKAFGMLQEAAMMEPNNSRVHLVYSYMLFRRAINENDPEYKAKLLKKGMVYYKRAGGLSKHTFLSSVVEDKMTYNILKSFLQKENIIVQ